MRYLFLLLLFVIPPSYSYSANTIKLASGSTHDYYAYKDFLESYAGPLAKSRVGDCVFYCNNGVYLDSYFFTDVSSPIAANRGRRRMAFIQRISKPTSAVIGAHLSSTYYNYVTGSPPVCVENCFIDWSTVIFNQSSMLVTQNEIIADNQELITSVSETESNLVGNQTQLLSENNKVISKADLSIQSQSSSISSLSSLESNAQSNLISINNINDTLENNHTEITSLINEVSPYSANDYQNNSIDAVSSVVVEGEQENKDALTSSINSLVSNSAIEASPDNIISTLNDYIPQGQACDISFTNPVTNEKINFDTSWSHRLKEILAWVIAFYTFIALIDILFTPVSLRS